MTQVDRRAFKLGFLLVYVLYIVKNVFRQIAFALYQPRLHPAVPEIW